MAFLRPWELNNKEMSFYLQSVMLGVDDVTGWRWIIYRFGFHWSNDEIHPSMCRWMKKWSWCNLNICRSISRNGSSYGVRSGILVMICMLVASVLGHQVPIGRTVRINISQSIVLIIKSQWIYRHCFITIHASFRRYENCTLKRSIQWWENKVIPGHS